MLHLAGSMRRPGIYLVTAKLPERDGEFDITSSIPVNCSNALRGKASFKRPADEAHPMNAMAAPLMC
jgi:hypothetical protein